VANRRAERRPIVGNSRTVTQSQLCRPSAWPRAVRSLAGVTFPRLHEGQLDITDTHVRALVDSQFPQWAGLPLAALDSTGTVNRVDLLGEDLVVRIPIIEWGAADVVRDAELLPMLAPLLPVKLPDLVGRGAPTDDVPWAWGVYSRLPGRHPVLGDPADEEAVAAGLIETVRALRSVSAAGGSEPAALAKPSPTGFDPANDDAHTRPRIEALGSPALTAAWDAALAASAPAYTPTFIHGDLMPTNLLLADAAVGPRLTGVLDWASAGIGDPALDLLPAWACLTSRTRPDFLEALAATDGEIARARGYAARKIGWGLLYYRESLPGFAALLTFMLEQLEA